MPGDGVSTMNFSHQRTLAESLREYGQGVAGGLIFALPLLFTMELWDSALTIDPCKLLLYVAFTMGLLFLYNRYAGLRRDASLWEVWIDSIEELGIGLILSTAFLYLLGRIGADDSAYEILNRIVMEGMTLAIGVSVGTAQLGTDEKENEGGMDGDDDPDTATYDYPGQSAIALCGAVLFAANIAPTEEVEIVARESSPARLAGFAIVAVGMGIALLYFSEFRGSRRHLPGRTWWLVAREIITSYAAALAASAALLYFFAGATPFHAAVIVVSLPAMLGASAGRLLLQVQTPQRSPDHE